jgi:hypothetical protein
LQFESNLSYFHSLSTGIHTLITSFSYSDFSKSLKHATEVCFRGKNTGEKIKEEKFGREVGKSVILCQLIQN